MRRPRRHGALRIALVAPLVLAAVVARDAAAFGEKLPWGEREEEECLSLAVVLFAHNNNNNKNNRTRKREARGRRTPARARAASRASRRCTRASGDPETTSPTHRRAPTRSCVVRKPPPAADDADDADDANDANDADNADNADNANNCGLVGCGR